MQNRSAGTLGWHACPARLPTPCCSRATACAGRLQLVPGRHQQMALKKKKKRHNMHGEFIWKHSGSTLTLQVVAAGTNSDKGNNMLGRLH